jgi:hypothetical protein
MVFLLKKFFHPDSIKKELDTHKTTCSPQNSLTKDAEK